MRIFIDTEFIEDGRTIELLSLGAVREDGTEFYVENVEADWTRANDWVQQHVLPHLGSGPRMARSVIASSFRTFAGFEPEFWGYYADYDWVVLCQLYGTMMDLPQGWPMLCRDLRQSALDKNLDLESIAQPLEHHALADARWNRDAWYFLYPSH